MDDEEFEYDEGCEYVVPQRRFMRADLVVLGLDLANGIVSAVASTLAMAQSLAAAHANFINAQEHFREEAALQIEQMTSGDSDG